MSWRVTSLATRHVGDERRVDDGRGRPHARGGPGRRRAERLEGLDAAQLDLEHRGEPRLVGEERREVRRARSGGSRRSPVSPTRRRARTWQPSKLSWSTAS